MNTIFPAMFASFNIHALVLLAVSLISHSTKTVIIKYIITFYIVY